MMTSSRYSEFVRTMINEFGLSLEYADAAWFTISIGPSRSSGMALARCYCQRFNIKPI